MGEDTGEVADEDIWNLPDHNVLGLESPLASVPEINSAFRQLALKYHPDKQHGPTDKAKAEDRMKRLNVANRNMLKATRQRETPSNQRPAHPPTVSPTASISYGHMCEVSDIHCAADVAITFKLVPVRQRKPGDLTHDETST